MAILEKEVLVNVVGKVIRYYEEKGYKIPKYVNKNNKGKLSVKKGTKILVRVEDLQKGSNIELTKVCDIESCGKEVPNQPFFAILKSRLTNKNGLDKCSECSNREKAEKINMTDESNCVATTHPEFAKLFWNVEDTYKYRYQSKQYIDFKCPKCGNKIENKKISDSFNQGLPCSCKGGTSYPEKLMFNLLDQLNVNFIKEFSSKDFAWCNNYRYDFYLSKFNIIIETHGIQHYEHKGRGRSLEEEQDNDRLKELLALKNGIKKENYVVIDCRYSELEFIRNNILNSQLNDRFDLSTVDWIKCHEYACNSRVKEVCDLWNDGFKSVAEIRGKLQLSKLATTTYLKRGVELGWCDYDPKEEKRKGNAKAGKSKRKQVVQLSLDGNYIKTWDSISEASIELGGISIPHISSVCNGKRKTSAGYRWMFKEEYELALK